MRSPLLLLIAALSLATSACFSGKKPVKVTPPAVVPVAVPVATPQPVPVPVAEPTPPAPEPVPVPVPVPEPPKPAPPKPVVRTTPAPTPAPTPVPQLREMIGGDRRKQYQAEYGQGVARANAALRQAASRTLTPAQKETAARIRTFLQQANSAVESDLSTALQLARRADLLGQDLVRSLK